MYVWKLDLLSRQTHSIERLQVCYQLQISIVFLWLQLYVQKVLCSEGPMFRRFYVQKVLCSEGPMLRRFYIQKVLCSESRGDHGTRRFCNVEATSMTLIQCRKNVVCSVGFSELK